MSVEPCLYPGETDLPDDTPLYKYLSIEAFLHLLECTEIIFSRISTWPDAYEGLVFGFLNKHRKDKDFLGRSKHDLYGSCWTLQREDPRLYASEDAEEYKSALAELQEHGSAAMWENYCRNGGVRIRTTLGKMTELLEREQADARVFRGRAQYTSGNSGLTKAMTVRGTAPALFLKRVAFRHEAEYRYILLPKNRIDGPVIPIRIGRPYDFLDEVLICPATRDKTWAARALYLLSVGISCDPGKGGSNTKKGRQFCRISQLYGTISQEI